MNPLQAIVVAVRLFAVWLALSLFTSIPGVWTLLRWQSPGPGEIVMAMSGTLFTAAVALFLWLFPVTVARALLPGTLSEQQTGHTAPDEWFLIGTRLMGLWILCRAIPSLLFQIAYLYQAGERDAERLSGAPTRWSVLRVAVECLIALWLLLGARGLLGILRLARRPPA